MRAASAPMHKYWGSLLQEVTGVTLGVNSIGPKNLEAIATVYYSPIKLPLTRVWQEAGVILSYLVSVVARMDKFRFWPRP
jgi:hypothetical protein